MYNMLQDICTSMRSQIKQHGHHSTHTHTCWHTMTYHLWLISFHLYLPILCSPSPLQPDLITRPSPFHTFICVMARQQCKKHTDVINITKHKQTGRRANRISTLRDLPPLFCHLSLSGRENYRFICLHVCMLGHVCAWAVCMGGLFGFRARFIPYAPRQPPTSSSSRLRVP